MIKALKEATAIIFLFVSTLVMAQDGEKPLDFVNTVEQSLNLFYQEMAKGDNYDSIMDALNYEANEVPEFSDEIYCERIQKLADMSPMPYACEDAALKTVKFFAEKRRNFTKVVIGRSALYFDMYEEKLAKHGLPLELKYLSVIESGLRPQVKSRSGALGLWQFMYGTGKMFGLKENSYIDERMDPEKATEAACAYLKKLHGIYNDWFLALAAYNAGPGNVNKAIRRSGGKKTYWEIRPYLPRETQGYVPNFIAASYLMTYHKEHNIVPFPAKIHAMQLDTMCFNVGTKMEYLATIADWSLNDIKTLNPIYKANYIPKTEPAQCITGPIEKIGLLITKETELRNLAENGPDSTFKAQMSSSEAVNPSVVKEVNSIQHVVKNGETLAQIANDYGVSVRDLIESNSLTNGAIQPGKKLTINNPKKLPAGGKVVTQKPATAKKYYKVRSGDTFSNIARRYGLTQTQLKRLNPGINISRLSIGQKLRVR